MYHHTEVFFDEGYFYRIWESICQKWEIPSFEKVSKCFVYNDMEIFIYQYMSNL